MVRASDASADWLVPTLHAGAVVVGARIGASLLWPDAFDVTDVSDNWVRFRRGWSSAPQFDTDKALFEWDGDHPRFTFRRHTPLESGAKYAVELSATMADHAAAQHVPMPPVPSASCPQPLLAVNLDTETNDVAPVSVEAGFQSTRSHSLEQRLWRPRAPGKHAVDGERSHS